MARLPDADQDRFPVPRFDPRRADRLGPGAIYGPGAARRDARDSRVAVVLFQKSDVRAEALPGTRPVHTIDEAEEHAAPPARRRVDYAPGAGVLRLILATGATERRDRETERRRDGEIEG